MSLPPLNQLRARSYGTIKPTVMVIHFTAGAWPSDGSGDAHLCVRRSEAGEAGTWHFTVGNDGTAWQHLDWTQMGAHDAGINAISVGIEHCGSYDTPWMDFPEQLEASARITAAFCRYIGRKPSREFIIGHNEDHLYGGTSTHGDPGPDWPWVHYMDLVQKFYRRRTKRRGRHHHLHWHPHRRGKAHHHRLTNPQRTDHHAHEHRHWNKGRNHGHKP